MLISTDKLLQQARQKRFAVGGFNVYNLEGALAVTQTAEEMNSPVILQLLPSALTIGGSPLIKMCMELANNASVPVSVHLDHCNCETTINSAVQAGLASIMADGSALDYESNITFTRKIVETVTKQDGFVEAELGKLSGEEDGITVAQREAQLTDPEQAVDFVNKTSIGALAVCIGNVHGKYHEPPQLDFALLKRISKKLSLPLVLHGTSGLPDAMITQAIELGICKFNVNTEVRTAYVGALAKTFEKSLANSSKVELVKLMQEGIVAMKEPVRSKIMLFCSADKASEITT